MSWGIVAVVGLALRLPPANLGCVCTPPMCAVRLDSREPLAHLARASQLQKPPTLAHLSRDLSDVVWSMALSGHLGASTWVYVEESDSTRIRVGVRQGSEHRWGRISLRGSEQIPLSSVAEHLVWVRGRECRLNVLEQAIGRILELYSWGGHPFAQVVVESITVRGTELDAVLGVDEGSEIRWGRLKLEGTEKTKEATAARIVGFRTGDLFDARMLEDARRRMTAPGLFAWVDEPSVVGGASPHLVDVVIRAKEARTSSVAGAIGYVPRHGQRDGYFVGNAELDLQNMAGTGRSATVTWRRIAPGASDMSLGYREPWLFGTPFSVAIGVCQEVKDTTYTKRRGELEVGVGLGRSVRGRIGAAGERITPARETEGLLEASVKYEGSVVLTWEARDNLMFPEHGSFAEADLSYGHRRSQTESGEEKTPEATLAGRGEVYVPVGERRVLVLAVEGRALVSDAEEVPLPLQFPLGGAGSLRGYREEQFRGAQVAWVNVDLRLVRWPEGTLGPFFDTGYYHLDRSQGGEGGKLKVGYGLSLRSLTRLGLLSLDYGAGEDTDLLNGRIHVSLRALF
jgi:outer membrane protein assembly factor BamA